MEQLRTTGKSEESGRQTPLNSLDERSDVGHEKAERWQEKDRFAREKVRPFSAAARTLQHPFKRGGAAGRSAGVAIPVS